MPEIIPDLQDLFEELPPSDAPWVALDQMFVAADYGLPDNTFAKNDADLIEIAIINGKVQRTYRSKS